MTAVISIDTVYFFCSTNGEGTKGIRRLKNFVVLFTLYRAFFRAYVLHAG